jgi:2-polyprenyl-3-methyl-5-hydroxy-6-metoxy-1,4-benzoquinol methylase
MDKSSVVWNIEAHDRIAKKYEAIHFEIYNDVEQARLNQALQEATGLLRTGSTPPIALDYGCGAGNLTRKLVDLGCNVIASDVSNEFLKLVQGKADQSRVTTLQLNGDDLREMDSASVDLVATYSVLHHVPDYLKIVGEFCRIIKPGGIVFIDHEKTADYWLRVSEYSRVYKEMTPVHRRFSKYLRLANYKTWFIRRFIDRRYSPEGDIHVYPDDHINWPAIDETVVNSGFEILRAEEYLLFRGDFDVEKHRRFASDYRDMRLLVARKLPL